MRAVKFAASLLTLVVITVVFCGCDTPSTRRSLYSPKKGDGYWTRSLQDGTWKERGTRPPGEKPAPEPAPMKPAAQ